MAGKKFAGSAGNWTSEEAYLQRLYRPFCCRRSITRGPRFSWEEIFFPAIDSGPALCSTQRLLGLNIEHAKRATPPRVVDHTQQKRGRDDLA
jgi:hypothetical protein